MMKWLLRGWLLAGVIALVVVALVVVVPQMQVSAFGDAGFSGGERRGDVRPNFNAGTDQGTTGTSGAESFIPPTETHGQPGDGDMDRHDGGGMGWSELVKNVGIVAGVTLLIVLFSSFSKVLQRRRPQLKAKEGV